MPKAKKRFTLIVQEDFDLGTIIDAIYNDMGQDGLKDLILKTFAVIDDDDFFNEMKNKVAELE